MVGLPTPTFTTAINLIKHFHNEYIYIMFYTSPQSFQTCVQLEHVACILQSGKQSRIDTDQMNPPGVDP